ncbi:hypothetical protein [Streptomyces sp. DH41]|uniref:hypothetical protein n=1 Tax=Streptomyces sp. DH41 TaxID=3040125 RepID=UPI002442295C|nr:hypothetical protein [Streptomyces sp. DH41]MDG9727581.1 hypothetical protein [Streptomyces sp. DH41]
MPALPWTMPNRPPQATQVHAPASRGLAGQMRGSKFASWPASSDEPPVSWAEVRRRLT